MKQRIGIDMDQVLADLMTEWLNRYNADYNDNLKPEDITSWEFHMTVKPECGKRIYTYLDNPHMFSYLPVMDGAQDVVYELSKYFDIFVVTAVWNIGNVAPKYNWLRRYFPFLDEKNFVFTRNKSIVNADFLIDDKPSNFDGGFRGQGILFDAPHNRNENRYPRVHNWEEVREWFLG
jgi:5'-nucleotidase